MNRSQKRKIAHLNQSQAAGEDRVDMRKKNERPENSRQMACICGRRARRDRWNRLLEDSSEGRAGGRH